MALKRWKTVKRVDIFIRVSYLPTGGRQRLHITLTISKYCFPYNNSIEDGHLNRDLLRRLSNLPALSDCNLYYYSSFKCSVPNGQRTDNKRQRLANHTFIYVSVRVNVHREHIRKIGRPKLRWSENIHGGERSKDRRSTRPEKVEIDNSMG